MALDATVKGASSNSYATRSQANFYFADRLGASTVWDGATDASKDASLIMATRYSLNVHFVLILTIFALLIHSRNNCVRHSGNSN